MPTGLKLSPMVLVIDDDHCINQLCTLALERVGFHVTCCDTTVKAANQIQSHGHRIVCILSDVVLAPGAKLTGTSPAHEGNGARLLPLLKYVCPSAIAIQMSAYSEGDLAAMAYRVEVEHFLQKPFTPEMLRAKIRQLLPHFNIPRSLTLPADDVAWDL